MLPDDVLLEIFDFYRRRSYSYVGIWKWPLLVQVCQRWRQIIFASPQSLDLQIFCTSGTPVRKNLGHWPDFPIVIDYHVRGIAPYDEDNVIAALEHPNRIITISLRLNVDVSRLEDIAAAMQGPFPVLTYLNIISDDADIPILLSRFSGGSAPRLETINVCGTSVPALPTLLLSASNLVDLKLNEIPQTGYISPETLVAGLETLTRLEFLDIGFESPASRPDHIPLPPVTRTVLLTLTYFVFTGASEYLEDFAARIDAPRLDMIFMNYWDSPDIHVSQAAKFINHSENLKRSLSRSCNIGLEPDSVSFFVYTAIGNDSENMGPCLEIRITCEGIDRQVSQMTHVLSQYPAILSHMVRLNIDCYGTYPDSQTEGIDDVEWTELFRPFSTVETLVVSRTLARYIALVLEDSAEEVAAQVLPALGLLFLPHQPASSVGKFITVRRDSGRPVTVVKTQDEFDSDERLKRQ